MSPGRAKSHGATAATLSNCECNSLFSTQSRLFWTSPNAIEPRAIVIDTARIKLLSLRFRSLFSIVPAGFETLSMVSANKRCKETQLLGYYRATNRNTAVSLLIGIPTVNSLSFRETVDAITFG
jgi:hypothetical protein